MAIFNKNKSCSERNSYLDFLIFVGFLLIEVVIVSVIAYKFRGFNTVTSNDKYDVIDTDTNTHTYYVKDKDNGNVYVAIVNKHNVVTYYRLANDDDGEYADIKDITYTLNAEE